MRDAGNLGGLLDEWIDEDSKIFTIKLTKGGELIMYILGNPKTKKQLKEWVASGHHVEVYSPGPFPAPTDGDVSVEGPHYPAPHTWYARVRVENGRVIKVVA